MAGPSIMVRVLGDLSSLGQSFSNAGTQGQSAASKMHSAFSSMLGQLNATGVLGPFGGALATADQAMQSISGHGKEISSTLVGIGGAAAGLGLALSAMGSKDAASHQQLQAAIGATGKSYDQYATKIEGAISHQAHFGNSAADTQDALRVLTQATNSPTEALKLLNTATDLAAAKHESLSQAASTLGKAYNGSGKVMKEFGITVSATGSASKELETATKAVTSADAGAATAKRSLAELEATDATKKSLTTVEAMKLQDAQAKVTTAVQKSQTAHETFNKAQHDVATGTSLNTKAIDELGKKLAGQASAQADTFSGHMKALRTEITNHVAEIGQKYGPALTEAGSALAGVGATMKVVQAATELFRGTQVVATAATDAETVSTDALNTSLLANPLVWIVLLIAGLVAALILAYQHSETFRQGINDLWNTVQSAFNLIWGAIKAVFDWLVQNWPLVLGILLGPFGLLLGELIKHWSTVTGWLEGLPGDIASITAGMWHGITDAFKDALNALIDLWNDLHFTLPSIDFGPIHLGGETIGVPHIPHLAQGGLITQSGLVFAHAGEAISPVPHNTFGPAVSVGVQHFHSGVDVDAFMQKAAWHMRTRRP
jgi:hypothetical protein